MEYMGEFNLLQWTGDYFIQIPSGLKEKGLEAANIMEILRDVLTSKEIKQLDDMESLSASLPLKKKTAKEVVGKIAKEAADQGMAFLVDTLIEATLDIDMGTNVKDSLFSELFSLVMDEEERSYIASVGKYEQDQLFFESIVPTSDKIQPFFHTEYEADFFVAHVALNTYEKTNDFVLSELEDVFSKQLLDEKTLNGTEADINFCYHGINYPIRKFDTDVLSYNMFAMDLDMSKQ